MAFMLRLTLCALASITLASAQHWPPQLRGNPLRVIRLPQGGERLRIPESTVIRLPEEVRSAMMCCKAMTAQCLACAAGQDVTRFCQGQGGGMPGCADVRQKAQEAKRERAIDGALTKLIDKAAGAVGGGQAQAMADKYLAQHPGVARKNLANLTGEVFGALENMKHGKQQAAEETTIPPHRHPYATTASPHHHHGRHHKSLAAPKPEVDDEDDDDEDEEQAPSPFSFSNPWFIAGGALLVTAISTGIAMGALCHARLGRTAREPLLSTLLAQEMETPVSGHAPNAD